MPADGKEKSNHETFSSNSEVLLLTKNNKIGHSYPQATRSNIILQLIKLNWKIKYPHYSPIYGECLFQSGKALALPLEQGHQDNSNDSPRMNFRTGSLNCGLR